MEEIPSKNMDIEITYSKRVPIDAVKEFKQFCGTVNIPVRLETKNKQSEHLDSIISDILIYISQHQTEILVNDIIIPSALIGFFAGVKLLYSRIKKKIDLDATQKRETNFIALVFCFKQGKLIIPIEASLNNDEKDVCLDELSHYLQSGQLETILGNMDYSTYLLWWEGTLNYDNRNHHWYPVYYGSHEKRLAQVMKRASDTGH
jgi:hypothetical protein